MEVGDVVVATRVLVGDRLVTVDVPDGGLRALGGVDQIHRAAIAEDVVQRAEAAAELVRRVVGTDGLGRVDPTGVLQRLQRVLHGVGVEVTEKQLRLVGELIHFIHPGGERLGLRDAIGVRIALPRSIVLTGTLRLEVIHHGDEFVFGIVHACEGLSQRMTSVRERGVREHQGRTGRLDDVLFVDEGCADHIGIGPDIGGGRIRPHLGTGSGVEGVDQCGQRQIGILLVPLRLRHVEGVLDLHQTDDVGVELVDRLDDLGLLIGEGLRRVRAAHGAVVRRHRGAIAVGVRLTPLLVLAEVGEVVEYVERRDLHVAAHFRGGHTGVLDVHEGGLVTAQGRGRLEIPRVVAVVQDHRLGEGRVSTGAHRGVSQIRERLVHAGVTHVVDAGTVIERHGLLLVLGLIGLGLGARAHLVGGLVQRLVPESETHRTVLVERVVVGDGVRARRLDGHALVTLTLGVGGGPLGEFGRGDRVAALHGLGGGDVADLGHRVMLTSGSGDLQALTDLKGVQPGGLIHEDAIGRGLVILGGAAGARRLDVDAIETTGGVHRGDHAACGHRLAVQQGGVSGALDL